MYFAQLHFHHLFSCFFVFGGAACTVVNPFLHFFYTKEAFFEDFLLFQYVPAFSCIIYVDNWFVRYPEVDRFRYQEGHVVSVAVAD